MNRHVKNAIVASTSLIPMLGGPISVILDKYLPEHIEKRRNAFFEELNEELKKLLSDENNADTESCEFLGIFVEATRLAIFEQHREKIECLKSTVLNSALYRQNTSYDEKHMFMRLISDLTMEQINIIKEIHNNSLPAKEGTLLSHFERKWTGIDRDYLMPCVTELYRLNLIHSGHKTWGENEEKGEVYHRLTSLGIKFVEFIIFKCPSSRRRCGVS